MNRKVLYPSLAAGVLLILALLADSLYFSELEYRWRTKLFNRIIHEKEAVMEECMQGMKLLLADEDHHGSVPENDLFRLAEENKITILEFLDDRLVHWSDNDFEVPLVYVDSLYTKPIVFLQNGWFVPSVIEAGSEKIVGLLRVRSDYSLENEVVRSGFEREFGVSRSVGFSTDREASGYQVLNRSGGFLFSLQFPAVKEATGLVALPVLLWSAFLLMLLVTCIQAVMVLSASGRGVIAIFSAILFCLVLYFVLLKFPPGVFRLTGLFSPERFSMNSIVPSLGYLLIISLFTVFLSSLFFRYYPLGEAKNDQEPGDYFPLALFFIGVAGLFSLFQLLFSELVLDSNISFQPYKVLELSWYSLAGFVSVFFILLTPVLMMLRVIRHYNSFGSFNIFLAALPGIALIVILHHRDPETMIPLTLFFILLTICIRLTDVLKAGVFTITVIFSFIFGFYSLYVITIHTEEKTIENFKIQAVSFSTENDPEAEHLLLDIWPELSADTVLSGLMERENFNESNEDVAAISDYLRAAYFNGYWANFNFNIVLCRDDDPLRIGPGDIIFPRCFNFFDERIKRDGQRLTGTNFYFIDNQRGRAYYLGRMMFRGADGFMHGLFIELYGDVNVFQPGYSSILLDKRYHGYADLKDNSFAKYINGEIVLRTGGYPYDKTDEQYVVEDDYRIFTDGGFRHLLYKNGNATVIISRPVITAGNLIISFAYLFAVILLLSNIVALAIRRPVIRPGGIFNFRQKLQLSYIGVLLFSFLLIGIVIAYLTINQYKTKHYENIKEKLNSVYLELDYRLSMEKRIDRNWHDENHASLNELLISLSNIFNTDINLYNTSGELLATSRPEIFSRNLTSTRINIMALINLEDRTMSEFYQRERIGNLEYLSAYIPFFSTDDRILAYLNLPYFRIQSVLAREISNLIVAVINFTLILILLTMGITVVISRRLTAPLSMLGEGLSSVQLGRKTEHLVYRGNDEIGELVKQYNRMVDEIGESARRLANSEREYAWREMARQIAHEIKNPLTPMKLNVQQLLKSWKDKVPDFGEKLAQFVKNQVEYIDNLSSIATAFSSFAKMPQARPAEVDLTEQVRLTLDLFHNTEDVTIRVHLPEESKIIVFADKEHLNGIFSNLVKNSIQSIPPGRHGLVDVSIVVLRDRVIVSVKDNGCGIPEELQGKMFTPNFTTKSSGTGLGLSIVKKYAETAGGSVRFDSVPGKGTTFFVELPLRYTVEKKS